MRMISRIAEIVREWVEDVFTTFLAAIVLPNLFIIGSLGWLMRINVESDFAHFPASVGLWFGAVIMMLAADVAVIMWLAREFVLKRFSDD